MIKRRFEEARAMGQIVRVYREGLEDGWIDGFVFGAGEDFFAVEAVDKACRLDGFVCLRYCDVTDLIAPAPSEQFLRRALKARNLKPSRDLPIDLSSLDALLQSANMAFPLVVISYELDDSVCYIGRVQSVSREKIQMLDIGPDAEWDSAPTTRPLAGITCVSFGGAYEEALHLVSPAY